MPGDRVTSNDGHSLIRRKILPFILQHEKIEGGNEPVRRIACNYVYLFLLERSRQQSQIHDSRRSSETQIVSRHQSFVTIGTFHELVAKARAPFWRVCGRLRDGLQMKAPRIFSANLNRKRVVEPNGDPKIGRAHV